MKAFIFLLSIILLFYRCVEENEYNLEADIARLKKLNLEIFENLQIIGRGEKNGVVRAFKCNVYANDSVYLIPNFAYYTYDSLNPSLQKELIEYAKANGVEEQNATKYVQEKSRILFDEFSKSKMYTINAKQKNCGCIIFFPDGGGSYIMYFPKEIEIKDEVWKEYFAKSKMVEEHWYVGELKKN